MSITTFTPEFPLAVPPSPAVRTLADLLVALGDIDPGRVRFPPGIGVATEDDLLEIHAREKRSCELLDGVLVEKPMGLPESILAMAIGACVLNFVRQHNLGVVTGESGPMRLAPGLVRIPDVAFTSWTRLGGRVPREQIPQLAPELAVEVLSPGNTRGEMNRKLREYFSAGVRLVWMVDPAARTVTVHRSPDEFVTLGESDLLDGGDVLPGFTLTLSDLFAELDERD